MLLTFVVSDGKVEIWFWVDCFPIFVVRGEGSDGGNNGARYSNHQTRQ